MNDEYIFDFTNKKVDWKIFEVNLSNPVSPPEVLLYQTDSEIPMLHRRNISIVGAHAIVGKTFLISAIACAVLGDDGFLNMHSSENGLKVLFVDTEQDISDTQEVLKRIHRCNNWETTKNNPTIITLNLREASLKERPEIIELAIKANKPDLVLLDGIVDLVSNFNDIENSQKSVEMLTRWTTEYDCHIVTCLHINKGNAELRGHLGAFLKQKGELTLQLNKKDGYIEVVVIDSRHKPIEDFYFQINNKGLPEIFTPESKKPSEEKLKILFNEILASNQPISYKELTEKVKAKSKVRQSMSEKKVSSALKLGIIKKNEQGHYHLPTLSAEQTEMFLD